MRMKELEKVIGGLSELEGYLFSEYAKVSADEANIWYDRFIAVSDAIPLLKKQEAVGPIPPTGESDLWRCGNCNHQLFRCTHQRYCEMCGRMVKWE